MHWQLIDLEMSDFEYQIFVVVFLQAGPVKKSKQIFKISYVQINELPRALKFRFSEKATKIRCNLPQGLDITKNGTNLEAD